VYRYNKIAKLREGNAIDYRTRIRAPVCALLLSGNGTGAGMPTPPQARALHSVDSAFLLPLASASNFSSQHILIRWVAVTREEENRLQYLTWGSGEGAHGERLIWF